jgi:hypothetical protein
MTLGVAVLSTSATLLLFWPLVSHLGSALTDELDGTHFVWVLESGRQALMRSPGAWFEGNIFFPLETTRALAEHCLGYQPLYAPLAGLTGSPVVATNLVALLTFPLCAVAMFHLARAMVADDGAALLAAGMFAFAPIRMSQHMHLFGFFWTVWALYCTWQWLRLGARRFFWGAVVTVVLQIASSWYLGYFATIAVGVMLVTAAARGALRRPRASDAILAALIVIPLLFWMARPYLRVAAEYQEEMSPIDFIQKISADAVYSYVSVDPSSWLYGGWLGRASSDDFGWEKHLFFGLLCIVFAAVSLWSTGLRSPPTALRCAQVLVLVGIVLSLGPYLRVANHQTAVPLPYLVPYWLVPGFASIRAIARFALIAQIGAVLLAAHGLSLLLARIGERPVLRRLLIAGLFVGVVVEGGRSLRTVTIQGPSALPAYVQWLRRQGSGVLLEVPIGEEDHLPHLIRQAGVMYRSLYHHHVLANGYASFTPPQVYELMEYAGRLPAAEALRYVRHWGITHLAVHPDARSYRAWREDPVDREQIRERVVFDDGVVVSALREPEVPLGTLRLGVKSYALKRARRHGVVRVAFRNDGPAYWRGSAGRFPLRYRWRDSSGDVLLERTVEVRPPVVLAPGEVRYRRVSIIAPPPGRRPQALEIDYEGLRETAWTRRSKDR